jgi:hypothetical protein
LLFVKSICTDFDSLSFIRHFLVQIATTSFNCNKVLGCPEFQ